MPQPTAGRAASPLRAGQVQAVRVRVGQLNAIQRWEKVVKRDLQNSTEGGEAAYYYHHGELAKIVAQDYGETFQLLREYYLLPGGQLTFVFEKASRYNQPFYYDSAQAASMGGEAFDLAKSRIEETRSYFHQGQLMQQLAKPQPAAPLTQLRAEQKRLRADFTNLLHALNSPN